MSLPAGWQLVAGRRADVWLGPGRTAVRLSNTFHFECVSVAECCEHEDRGCTHFHRVGGILWNRQDGWWRCPHLTGEKRCGIYEKRPLVCRLFPLGVAVAPEIKRVVLFKYDPPRQCVACLQGRKWTVREWLSKNGFWEWASGLEEE